MKKTKTIFLISIMLVFATLNVYGEEQDRIYIRVNLWTNELIVVKNNKINVVYPISSGTDESPTPIGTFEIVQKAKSWGGGFGSRWLGLNVPWGQFGIHGTNRPNLIGKSVSGGCIRMQNKDIEQLFEIIPEGTAVYIDGPVTGKGRGEFKNLSLGSKGNLVQLVQQRLKLEGIYKGEVNGIYGLNTERAVKKFQRINNFPITGGISEREYRALGLLE